jgi:hypothetical protein
MKRIRAASGAGLVAAVLMGLPAACGADDAGDLRLDVREVAGGTLRISWYAQAPEVKGAWSAALTLRDGKRDGSLDLSHTQLGLGSILYRSESGTVIACLRLRNAGGELPARCIAYISGPALARDARDQRN